MNRLRCSNPRLQPSLLLLLLPLLLHLQHWRILLVLLQIRMSTEVEKYKQPPAVANNKDFDALGYWRDAGSPRLDPHGNVMAAAQFPILSVLARVYLCIDSTSCQSEREFSQLGFVHSSLRRRTTPDRVEKTMFLRTNSDLIPEVKSFEI